MFNVLSCSCKNIRAIAKGVNKILYAYKIWVGEKKKKKSCLVYFALSSGRLKNSGKKVVGKDPTASFKQVKNRM